MFIFARQYKVLEGLLRRSLIQAGFHFHFYVCLQSFSEQSAKRVVFLLTSDVGVAITVARIQINFKSTEFILCL